MCVWVCVGMSVNIGMCVRVGVRICVCVWVCVGMSSASE